MPKGYYTPDGYRGWTGTEYALFADETDYKEWRREHESDRTEIHN